MDFSTSSGSFAGLYLFIAVLPENLNNFLEIYDMFMTLYFEVFIKNIDDCFSQSSFWCYNS